jgi:hypothetical protein
MQTLQVAIELKDVVDEISKAEKFKGHLSALFIATTADHDAKLQEQVCGLAMVDCGSVQELTR